MTDRDRALAFLRGQDRLLADRVEPLRYGEALLTASLPRVYDGNFIVVEHLRPGAGAEMVADDAERIMGGAGLGHRRVDVADDETATRLAPGLGRLGWDAQTFLLMTLRSAPSAATGTEEVAPADLAGLRAEAIRTYPWGSPDLVEQLLERDRRRAERTMVRAFAVRADGRLVSQALLFRDGSDVAQVENVETLEGYRGRGYARAVVAAAIHAAADASLIFLITDADDWPQKLYGKLGFQTAGRMAQFLRRV